jgi:hypothetical protein
MSEQLTVPMTGSNVQATPCRIHDLECRLARIADAGPGAIDDRLTQLEWEWTAGRMAKVTAATIILAGTALTLASGSMWWLLLPAAGGLFLLQYAASQTALLSVAFREMGYRTGCEVEQEKFALKTLRGDFRHLPTVHDIEAQEDISRLEGEGGIVVEVDAHKVDPREAVREVVQATRQV